MKITDKNSFDEIINIFAGARRIVLNYFRKCHKICKAPMIDIDIEVNNFLRKKLKELYPNIPFFSEEGDMKQNKLLLKEKILFIVDPIDGTNAFKSGSANFTINISLKIGQGLLFSAIFLPIYDTLYFAEDNKLYKLLNISDYGAQKRQQITFSKNYSENSIMKVLTTQREGEYNKIKKQFDNYGLQIKYQKISSAVKFCNLAEGKADIYLRRAKIKLWDAIAGFHITSVVGLEVKNLEGANIMEYLLSNRYLQKIANEGFRIDEFLIKSPTLTITSTPTQ